MLTAPCGVVAYRRSERGRSDSILIMWGRFAPSDKI